MKKENRSGKKIVCIIGPSGSGKTTIGNHLQEVLGWPELISDSAGREIRPGEIDGVTYNFISTEEFKEKIEKDMYVEHVEIYGNYYGLSKEVVNKTLKKHDIAYFICNLEGLQAIERFAKWNNIDVISFHIKAPIEVLRARIEARGDSKEQIEKRVKEMEKELSLSGFDFTIENTGHLDIAIKEILKRVSRKKKVLRIKDKKTGYKETLYIKSNKDIGEIKKEIKKSIKENPNLILEEHLKGIGVMYEFINIETMVI